MPARRRSQHLLRREFNPLWPLEAQPAFEASPSGRCERTWTLVPAKALRDGDRAPNKESETERGTTALGRIRRLEEPYALIGLVRICVGCGLTFGLSGPIQELRKWRSCSPYCWCYLPRILASRVAGRWWGLVGGSSKAIRL